jgi:hypothetical protein
MFRVELRLNAGHKAATLPNFNVVPDGRKLLRSFNGHFLSVTVEYFGQAYDTTFFVQLIGPVSVGHEFALSCVGG